MGPPMDPKRAANPSFFERPEKLAKEEAKSSHNAPIQRGAKTSVEKEKERTPTC